ncbi:cell wall-associated NlpC family hydrolase [Motilibacter rhizosphaerae]|uniref:Cell wall-associated NlpC family hydrolase n=1 Tax=Motilibacter rhizosphaerae TaxID=598652 RepID=A0A4Q7NS49_9ACTN|nr:NlpC/P60 family protein [Motilibacter rhizosphaerae]RZS87480.1 cell wall-associated NlpC family hydrolase [Motilibacter rhizosphaerae]
MNAALDLDVPSSTLDAARATVPAQRRGPGAHRRPAAPSRTAARVAALPVAAAAIAGTVGSTGTASAASSRSAHVEHATPAHAAVRATAASLLRARPTVTPVVAAHPLLDTRSRGGAVRFVQRRLGVRPSGTYGAATASAVRRFQRASGLQVTGTVTQATWRALGVAGAKRASIRSVSLDGTPGSLAFGKLVLAAARANAGGRYRYGGTSPRSGFDCSGYVSYVYRQLGIALPHSSAAMRSRVQRISRSQVRPGDLVFVSRGGRVSHVAIYAGGGYWYEAQHPGTRVGLHKAWTSSVSYGRVA